MLQHFKHFSTVFLSIVFDSPFNKNLQISCTLGFLAQFASIVCFSASVSEFRISFCSCACLAEEAQCPLSKSSNKSFFELY